MIKVTEDGIKTEPENELSEEDLDFINEMFQDHSDYEKDQPNGYYNA